MILFSISIPFMIHGVAVAAVPLLAAMRIESRLERGHARALRLQPVPETGMGSPAAADDVPLAA